MKKDDTNLGWREQCLTKIAQFVVKASSSEHNRLVVRNRLESRLYYASTGEKFEPSEFEGFANFSDFEREIEITRS